MTTCKSTDNVLDRLGIAHEELTVYGIDYVIASGTGEVHYGSALGRAAFAYDADDLDVPASDYTDFCERVDPIGPDDPNWDALSVALAVRGHRLTIAGACTPAMSDREYLLVRLAAGCE
jgi:hypothetical protein